MTPQDTNAFEAAIAACQRLHQIFPQDHELRAVIDCLKAWKEGRTTRQPASDLPLRRHVRGMDQSIRPLSEEIAAMVHAAELCARQLHLS